LAYKYLLETNKEIFFLKILLENNNVSFYTNKLLINKIFIDILIIFIISTIPSIIIDKTYFIANDIGIVQQLFFYHHYYYYTLSIEYHIPPIILLLFDNFLMLYIDHDYGLKKVNLICYCVNGRLLKYGQYSD